MEQNKLVLLRELFSRSDKPLVWQKNAIDSLSLKWNEPIYKTVLNSLDPNLDIIKYLESDFELPTNQTEIQGELNLGYLLEDPNIDFNIPLNRLPLHLFTAGMSGFGKSNFAKILAEQLIQNTQVPFHIYDPKADEFTELAQKYPDIPIFTCKELKFNPLIAPPGMPQLNWSQVSTDNFSQSYNFWIGAESDILDNSIKVFDKYEKPTLKQLLNEIISAKTKYGYKDQMIKSTVVSRLKMLLNLFGDSITTNSKMLEVLSNRRVIILTRGLLSEAESWFTVSLLLWEYFRRVYNPDNRDLVIRFYDECQHRLFSSEKERNIQKTSSSLTSQLVDQARALNIGICSLSQEPSTLLKSVVNNSWLKVAFHLNSGGEIKVMKEAMGLDEEQTDHLFYLEPGEAIVRTAGGFMDAMLVKFHEFENLKVMNDRDFWQYQKELKAKIYEESEIEKHIDNKSLAKPKTSHTQIEKVSKTNKTQPLSKAVKTAHSIVKIWLNLKHPFLIQSKIFEKAGINSGSLQAQIKKYLLREKLIKEYKIQYSKTYVIIWEPTEKAYKIAGVKKPQFKSKGGYLHQFIAHHINSWAIANGYSVDFEFFLANNKAVDLILRNNNELVFVEIGLTSLRKEIDNILKDFGTNLTPDKLFMVVKDNKDKQSLSNLINSDRQTTKFRDKIEIKLAGEFLRK